GGEMMDTDLLIVNGPNPAEERTITSPPALVLEMATSKVRQGSGTVQVAASLPVSDTALRLFWANADVVMKIDTSTARQILGMSVSFCLRLTSLCHLQRKNYSGPKVVIVPEVSTVLPRTVLFPRDSNRPPDWYSPY